MIHNLHDQSTIDAHRHAYNAAFEELGLPWHWDSATFTRLQAGGRDGVRTYLQSEQPHLLRAYELEFLVDAIETAKARYHAGMAADSARRAAHAPWAASACIRLVA
ncbi:MAG: hypothetical protein EON92_17905 [Burkholderiales bacterium]|nr:MAG: hypothetical protein EON92_17905 [Burkholderiales bacterium]